MKKLLACAILAGCALTGKAAGAAQDGCAMVTIADAPVTMVGFQPLVTGEINGAAAVFVVDSGAYRSVVSRAAAVTFGLSLRAAPVGLTLRTLGGDAPVSLARVRRFSLGDLGIDNLDLMVAGDDLGDTVAGLLGQDVLGLADVDYDLANRSLKLVRATNCDEGALAGRLGASRVAILDLDASRPSSPHTSSAAFINGARVRVVFDTGAETSIMNLAAARRLGLDPHGAGAVYAGFVRGYGPRPTESWFVPVARFTLGGEAIGDLRLRVGGRSIAHSDMLIGADFFLAHHVYVANSRRKLYFTANGGAFFSPPSTVKPEADPPPVSR